MENRLMKMLLSVLAFAAALQAQISSFQQNGWIRFGDWTALPWRMNQTDGQSGPVLGKPFSGTEVRQTTQVLADGTHVNQSDTSKFYRDSQGRMRSESVSQVLIYDPVAGFIYTLNPQRKTYSRTRIQDASATVSIAASGNW